MADSSDDDDDGEDKKVAKADSSDGEEVDRNKQRSRSRSAPQNILYLYLKNENISKQICILGQRTRPTQTWTLVSLTRRERKGLTAEEAERKTGK
jgi:hypothetical protein